MMRIDTLAKLIGCEALLEFEPESWFEERDAIKALICSDLAQQPTQHWLDLLEPAGLWCAPVLDWPALAAHAAFDALQPVQRIQATDGAVLRTTRCPIRIDGRILTSERAAPRLGAETQAIDALLAEPV